MPTQKAIRYHEGVNSNSPGRHKSFTHIEHRAGTVGRGGWCIRFQSSLLKIYFRLSGFQASLLLIYFRDVPNITLRQRMAQNHPICDTLLSRPFLFLNRSPIQYDFRGGKKAIRNSVNKAFVSLKVMLYETICNDDF